MACYEKTVAVFEKKARRFEKIEAVFEKKARRFSQGVIVMAEEGSWLRKSGTPDSSRRRVLRSCCRGLR